MSGRIDQRACSWFVLCAIGLLGCSAYDDALATAKNGPAAGSNGGGGTGASESGSGGAGGMDASVEPGGSGGIGGSAGSANGGSSGTSGCAGTSSKAGSGSCSDECPDDSDKTAPGECGCGMSEADGDSDGTPDCVDDCPDNPDKQAPGTCGCQLSDDDGDGDGTPDCVDGCPDDPDKSAPGECGCGVTESIVDSDGDSTPDCIDLCPDDPGKQAPGKCGCPVAETDTDLDETPDCIDTCPSDPKKTAPGVCGCGIPDADVGTTVGCVALKNALVRRYRFEGSGMSVADSQGGPAGTVSGGSLSGSGTVVLTGGSGGPYVDLPNGILSGLTDATLEMWVNWDGGGTGWQRIFDFGTSGTEDSQGSGKSYLFLTPAIPGTTAHPDGVMNLAFSTNGNANETKVQSSTRPLPNGVTVHIAVVVDDTHDTLSLYINTTLEGTTTFTGHLSGITDVNDWLGHSQFSQDDDLAATFYEFRVYEAALTPAQLNFSLTQGTDPAYLQ